MNDNARRVMHSSKLTTWRTPEWFLRLVRQVGRIGFDPATSADNPTGADFFCTPEGYHVGGYLLNADAHGLEVGWPLTCMTFCNPPYGRELGTVWAPKMCAHDGEAVYLVPNRPETAWHRSLVEWCDMHLAWSSDVYGSRIKFVRPDGGKADGPAFPSSVFYSAGDVKVRTHRTRLRRFRSAFGPHGRLTEITQ